MMRALKFLMLSLFALGTVCIHYECAHAAEPIAEFAVGANGIWMGGVTSLPSDFEVGGAGRASFSPHISAVGGAWYGTGESYLRGTIGPRFAISDANDPDFNIGIGVSYVACSKPEVRPEEFQAEVALGWAPYPQTMPNVTIGALGAYGLDSKRGSALVAFRYSLGYPNEHHVVTP